jgi:hypothetical protein
MNIVNWVEKEKQICTSTGRTRKRGCRDKNNLTKKAKGERKWTKEKKINDWG